MLEFSTEADNTSYSEHEAHYFTPAQNLSISSCCPSLWTWEDGVSTHKALWPRDVPYNEDAVELVEDYYDGRHLASVITRHPSPWQQTSPGDPDRLGARYTERLGFEHRFLVLWVFDKFSKRKPHQILLMVSDHVAEEDFLLRSEVLAMTTFMKWKMQSMRHEQSLVYPVMVISITNLLKVSVLQGNFDGTFNIRRSKLYDFAVEDHEDVMKRVVSWLRSTAHGDTTLSLYMPIFRPDSHDDDNGNADEGENKDMIPDNNIPES